MKENEAQLSLHMGVLKLWLMCSSLKSILVLLPLMWPKIYVVHVNGEDDLIKSCFFFEDSNFFFSYVPIYGTPLQHSCLENPMDGGAWWAAVHGVDFTFTFHFHALEKEMATHSSVPAWRIPEMGEPGRLPSMGSHRVGHNWSDLAAVA